MIIAPKVSIAAKKRMLFSSLGGCLSIMLIVTLDSVENTLEFGRSLGQQLPVGAIVCLKGELGVGKTTFVKGIAKGLAIAGLVSSPTFTIINHYEGKLPLYHIDTYRMNTAHDLIEIGIEDYLPPKDGVTVIEWPELIADLLPQKRLEATLAYLSDNQRELILEDLDGSYHEVLEEMKQHVGFRNR